MPHSRHPVKVNITRLHFNGEYAKDRVENQEIAFALLQMAITHIQPRQTVNDSVIIIQLLLQSCEESPFRNADGIRRGTTRDDPCHSGFSLSKVTALLQIHCEAHYDMGATVRFPWGMYQELRPDYLQKLPCLLSLHVYLKDEREFLVHRLRQLELVLCIRILENTPFHNVTCGTGCSGATCRNFKIRKTPASQPKREGVCPGSRYPLSSGIGNFPGLDVVPVNAV